MIDIVSKWVKKGLKIASKLNNDYLMAYAKQRLGKIYLLRISLSIFFS